MALDFSHLKLQKPKKRTKDRQPALFNKTDFNELQTLHCPKCSRRLYFNRPRTIIRCKSKLHSFVLTAKAYEDIVSGKRLEDYKQHRKSLLK